MWNQLSVWYRLQLLINVPLGLNGISQDRQKLQTVRDIKMNTSLALNIFLFIHTSSKARLSVIKYIECQLHTSLNCSRKVIVKRMKQIQFHIGTTIQYICILFRMALIQP